jgi:hypothetical protein
MIFLGKIRDKVMDLSESTLAIAALAGCGFMNPRQDHIDAVCNGGRTGVSFGLSENIAYGLAARIHTNFIYGISADAVGRTVLAEAGRYGSAESAVASASAVHRASSASFSDEEALAAQIVAFAQDQAESSASAVHGASSGAFSDEEALAAQIVAFAQS